MSGWRRKALEVFPERSAEIQRVENITLLLVELNAGLRHAYAQVPPNRPFIDSVFDYAAWCFGPRQSHDLRNAVAVGFYEHVPYTGPDARRDLAHRLSADEAAELEPLFKQMLEGPVYAALHAEFDRVRTALPRHRSSAT